MRYKLLWRLNIDGKVYNEGDYVTLEASKAKELLASGVIQQEPKPFSKESDPNSNKLKLTL